MSRLGLLSASASTGKEATGAGGRRRPNGGRIHIGGKNIESREKRKRVWRTAASDIVHREQHHLVLRARALLDPNAVHHVGN